MEEFCTVYLRLPKDTCKVLKRRKYLMQFYGDDDYYSTPIGEDIFEEFFVNLANLGCD